VFVLFVLVQVVEALVAAHQTKAVVAVALDGKTIFL
jgi:hypothetical protein